MPLVNSNLGLAVEWSSLLKHLLNANVEITWKHAGIKTLKPPCTNIKDFLTTLGANTIEPPRHNLDYPSLNPSHHPLTYLTLVIPSRGTRGSCGNNLRLVDSDSLRLSVPPPRELTFRQQHTHRTPLFPTHCSNIEQQQVEAAVLLTLQHRPGRWNHLYMLVSNNLTWSWAKREREKRGKFCIQNILTWNEDLLANPH